MIERKFYGAPIDVQCDACPNGVETGLRDFKAAMATIHDDGWRTRRLGDDWLHFCPDCDVPDDLDNYTKAGRKRR